MPKHRIRCRAAWSRRGGPLGPDAGQEAARSIRPTAGVRPPTGGAWRSTGSRRTHAYAHRAGTAGVRLQQPTALAGASVDGLGDLGGLPLDLAKGTGGQQPSFDGVAERVGEHGTLAAGGRRLSGRALQSPGAGAQDGADGVRSSSAATGRDAVAIQSSAGDLRGTGLLSLAALKRLTEQGPAQDTGCRMPVCAVRLGQGNGDRGERLGGGRRDFAARPGHFICAQAQTCSCQVTLAGTADSIRAAARSPGQRACHRGRRHEGAQERVRQGPGGERLAASATAGTDRRRAPSPVQRVPRARRTCVPSRVSP